jgi:hypothetical protein
MSHTSTVSCSLHAFPDLQINQVVVDAVDTVPAEDTDDEEEHKDGEDLTDDPDIRMDDDLRAQFPLSFGECAPAVPIQSSQMHPLLDIGKGVAAGFMPHVLQFQCPH